MIPKADAEFKDTSSNSDTDEETARADYQRFLAGEGGASAAYKDALSRRAREDAEYDAYFRARAEKLCRQESEHPGLDEPSAVSCKVRGAVLGKGSTLSVGGDMKTTGFSKTSGRVIGVSNVTGINAGKNYHI